MTSGTGRAVWRPTAVYIVGGTGAASDSERSGSHEYAAVNVLRLFVRSISWGIAEEGYPSKGLTWSPDQCPIPGTGRQFSGEAAQPIPSSTTSSSGTQKSQERWSFYMFPSVHGHLFRSCPLVNQRLMITLEKVQYLPFFALPRSGAPRCLLTGRSWLL